MAEIIPCPQCGRRLRMAADSQAEWVRCPSCEKTFSAASMLTLPSPVQAELPPQAPPPIQTVASAPEMEFTAGAGHPLHHVVRRSSPRPCLLAALLVGAVLLIVGVGATALLYTRSMMVSVSGEPDYRIEAISSREIGQNQRACVLVIVWRIQAPRSSYALRIEEDEEEKREQLRKAFQGRKPLDNDEIAQQVRPLFDQLAAALRAQDADRIMALFDLDRLIDEFLAAGGTLPGRNAKQRREFRTGLHQGIGTTLAQRGAFFHWKATEIRNIKKLNNDEVVLIARQPHPETGTLKMRWWLTRRNGTWQIYDLEDLDSASRLSSEMVSLLGHGLGQVMELGKAIKSISEAIQAIALDDPDEADKKLAQVRNVPLPHRSEARRQFANGMVLLRREKYAEALRALEEAHRLQPDFPVVDFLRGVVLNKLDKPEEALKHLQAYRDLLGDDPDVCCAMGDALREQNRFPEAAKQYRLALDCNPKEANAFLGLLRSLGGDDNKDDVGPRFAKLDNRRENFDTCAEDCERREFPELLDPLVQTMRKLDPDYPPVDYYQALVQARNGHPDEAARSFQSALGKQPEKQQRQEYERHFLKVMASGGHYTQAYAAVSDGQKVFRFLAGEAMKHYQITELKRLVAAHASKHPADPLLALYQAEILVHDEQYDKADKAFRDALARHPDQEVLRDFRASRVLARYHTGQAMTAYRDIGPREETFAQLASLLLQDGKHAQLQALLDAHAKELPDSIEAAAFRYRLLIRQNKITEGIAGFKSALTKAKTAEKRSELVSQFLTEMTAANKPLEGYESAPDATTAFRQLADALLEDDRWDDLRRLLAAHRRSHAGAPWLAYYQAEVHQHDEAWDKMAAVLEEALKGNAGDARDVLRTSYVFALYKTGCWRRAYEESRPRDKTFTQLANLMIQDKKIVELETLLGLHRPHAEEDPDLPYYQARSKLLATKWAEAIPLFRQAYQKQANPYLRAQYQMSFLADMAAAGQWREGYRAAEDKAAAFTTLASRLLNEKKDKELAELLEEYHKAGGGEPWYSFYRGELELLRGEAKKAVRHFALALSKGMPADQWRLREGLIRARVRVGEAAGAYEEYKTIEGIFTSLASLCSQNKDVQQLRTLLDAHRRNQPDDPNLLSWELELRWLQEDYESVLRFVADHRHDVFAQPRFRWKANEYWVRALVKQKRGSEAVRAAEEIVTKHSGDRLLLVFAYAATADVSRTITAMGQLGNNAYFVRRCYQDDDLGPLLRSEGFQAFRERYPEPKKNRSTDET